jgi:hypothetical protein
MSQDFSIFSQLNNRTRSEQTIVYNSSSININNKNRNILNQILMATSKSDMNSLQKSNSSKNNYSSNNQMQHYKPGSSSSYNSIKNESSYQRSDRRTIVQNNINIGTLVGNLQLGPSMTLSSNSYSHKRYK